LPWKSTASPHRRQQHLKEVLFVLVDNSRPGAEKQAADVAFLTPKDLQTQLQIGERLCYKLLRSQAIPNARVAGMYRIKREDLEEALERGSVLEVRQ
jgi:excisionase family DNA binding protein